MAGDVGCTLYIVRTLPLLVRCRALKYYYIANSSSQAHPWCRGAESDHYTVLVQARTDHTRKDMVRCATLHARFNALKFRWPDWALRDWGWGR